MERRDFLKLAGMTGLAVAAGGAYGDSAQADSAYTGPLWLMIHMNGGWDVTSVCDPKGDAPAGDFNTGLNHYPTSAIGQAGNIRYAPLDQSSDLMKNTNMTFTAAKTFWDAHYQDMTVINGIDNATNSHDAGTRVTWAGNLSEGKPTVAALIAAAYLPTAPMGFVTFGGYDTTDGVVGAARLGNLDALKRLAYPYELNPNDADKSPLFLQQQAQAQLIEARDARYHAQMTAQRLPRVQNALSKLYTSRLGSNELQKLTQYLPSQKDQKNGLVGQAQLAIAAYRAGICVSANLQFGGWDSHGNNDVSVAGNLQGNNNDGLLPSLSAIFDMAKQAGVDNNMVICIGSDFGRTRGYNMGNGKDHWSITSMLVTGAINGQKITGNRVLGGTDETHNPTLIDPATMAPSPSGIRITPAHIQRAIRKAAGIDQNKIVANYPVDASEDLPIFALDG